jgi:hypothetical protein
LNPSRKKCDVQIREDINGSIYWAGVREEPCGTPEELVKNLVKGSLGRTTGSTDMNSVSSRSHAIFSVILKQKLPNQETKEERLIVSKFHFVDLAGSERVRMTDPRPIIYFYFSSREQMPKEIVRVKGSRSTQVFWLWEMLLVR